METSLIHDERAVLPGLVVARDRAEERVGPGLELQRSSDRRLLAEIRGADHRGAAEVLVPRLEAALPGMHAHVVTQAACVVELDRDPPCLRCQPLLVERPLPGLRCVTDRQDSPRLAGLLRHGRVVRFATASARAYERCERGERDRRKYPVHLASSSRSVTAPVA